MVFRTKDIHELLKQRNRIFHRLKNCHNLKLMIVSFILMDFIVYLAKKTVCEILKLVNCKSNGVAFFLHRS